MFPQLYLDEIVSGKQLAVAARDTCHVESYGKVFGLASAAPVAACIAQFAVWVEDAWQGRGVGAATPGDPPAARRSSPSVRRSGSSEPDNFAIRPLVNRIAPGATTRSEDGMIIVSVPLTELAAEPDARS